MHITTFNPHHPVLSDRIAALPRGRTSSLQLSLDQMPTDIVTKTMEPFGREVIPAFRR